MRRHHPIRRLSEAILVSAVLVAVGLGTAPAGAAGSVTCATVSGNQQSTALLFSCTETDETGGAGSIQPYPIFVKGTHTAKIYWSGPTMDQAPATVVRLKVHVLAKKKKTPCASGDVEIKVAGTVRSDTSGAVTVPGQVRAALCQASNGSFTLVPGTTFYVG